MPTIQTDPWIITPTARLARSEKRRLAEAQLADGAQAWRAPEVISFPALLAKLRDEAMIAGAINDVPISASQARMLWQQVIDTDVFIGEPRVHTLAERAWRTIHEYRLKHPRDWPDLLLSTDSRQFQAWADRFERLCKKHGVIDEWRFAAKLPKLITGQRLQLPKHVQLKGFELPQTPLQKAIFEALAETGAQIELLEQANSVHASEPTSIKLYKFCEPDNELQSAAEWARARVEAHPNLTVAVVVADLAARLTRIERIFRQVFDPPGFALSESGVDAWHISLGMPLAQWPLAADALLLLGLDPARIEQPKAGPVLASPYLAGADTEAKARARATADLMRRAPYEITGFELMAACKKAGADRLAANLDEWRERRGQPGARRIDGKHDTAWPSQWVEQFQADLQTLGFARGRTLDSLEYQTLARWHELLEEFSALDGVLAEPISRTFALSLLVERAANTTFRERNPGCPVEILGVEEALGSSFDAAWITTLDDETWPGPARRDPLIPGAVQADVPAANTETKLQRAQLELAGLISLANEIVGSFSTGNEDQQRSLCQLVRPLEIIQQPASSVDAPIELERIDDDIRAPEFTAFDIRGGTGALKDQSACPFRAFAVRRLKAGDLTPPRPGLDTAARGNLIHKSLELFWRGLKGRSALASLTPAELRDRIKQSAEHALGQLSQDYRLLLTPAGQRLELGCIVRALDRWLALERSRGEFTVRGLEQNIVMEFDGLKLTGKIDRIDETPVGTVLIDYKTGRASKSGWRPAERIDDPQLPAYALTTRPRPAALAFGRIRPDEIKFDGLCDSDVDIPGVTELTATRGGWKEQTDWNALLDEWQHILDALAHSFKQGRAEVHPRDGQTCRHCHLHALCRINQRQSLTDDGEAA